MNKSTNIFAKLQDFENFVKNLTIKMFEALLQNNKTDYNNTSYPLDLRLYKPSEEYGQTEIYEFPITLDDYLTIWNDVTETLQYNEETYIDVYANDIKNNEAFFIDVALFIKWDKNTDTYQFVLD